VTAIPRYAIIPTHNRHTELQRLITQLQHDVDDVIVVDNASDPPVDICSLIQDAHARLKRIRVLRDAEQPPHLYHMWNEGLAEIESCTVARRTSAWDVAIFNDDAIIPAGWFDTVSTGLRTHGVAAASTGWNGHVTRDRVLRVPGEGGFSARLCSWAFITRGELHLRADERFKWWYGDNDFDWTARQTAGVVLLPGPIVVNEHANSTTVGPLAEQSGHDAEAFKQKWSRLP